MSPKWQELFVQSVRDAERLGIDITLGIGPGWCGSGGPWVKPEQAMQHLVFSSVELKGPQSYSAMLPLPAQRSTEWHTMASPFYEDVAVLAFPSRKPLIADINEKALFRQGAVFDLEAGQALSAGFGPLRGAGAGGRHPAERDRGSHEATQARRNPRLECPGRGLDDRPHGTAGHGREQPARAIHRDRLGVRQVRREGAGGSSGPIRRETAGKNQPAREGARLDHPAHG